MKKLTTMKMALNSLVVLALMGVLLTYSGCKSHPKTITPPIDIQIDALSKHVWVATAVTRDTDTETGDYVTSTKTFTLTFTGTHGQKTVTYTANNRPQLSPWPQTGTFTFSDSSPTTNLTRNDAGGDNIPFVYNVTDTQLQLKFTYSGAGFAGRTSNVTGDWVFTMAAQ